MSILILYTNLYQLLSARLHPPHLASKATKPCRILSLFQERFEFSHHVARLAVCRKPILRLSKKEKGPLHYHINIHRNNLACSIHKGSTIWEVDIWYIHNAHPSPPHIRPQTISQQQKKETKNQIYLQDLQTKSEDTSTSKWRLSITMLHEISSSIIGFDYVLFLRSEMMNFFLAGLIWWLNLI